MDLWSSSVLVDMIQQRQILLEGTKQSLRANFVLNRIVKNTRLGSEISQALESSPFKTLETIIHQRQIYPAMIKRGLTVFESEDESAKIEMKLLAREVASLFEEVESLTQPLVAKEVQSARALAH